MNGHFRPWRGLPIPLAWTPCRRLIAALAASAALHAVAILAPFLGTSGTPAGNRPGAMPAFSATLVATRSEVATARVLPAPGEAPPLRPPSADERQASPSPRTGLDILPAAAPEFYTTDQLSKRPQPLVPAELDTPETTQLAVSGSLVLTLWIDPRGAVADVRVERSDLPEVFGQAAMAGFRNSRFTPGERDGRPVAVMMRIEVDYADARAPAR